MEMGRCCVSALLGPLLELILSCDTALIPHHVHKQEPSLRISCQLQASLLEKKSQANQRGKATVNMIILSGTMI